MTKAKKESKPKPKKVQVLVRFNEDVFKTLDSYCEAHGIVRNQYIAQATIKRLNSDIKQ